MRVLTVIGNRPQFIKASAVSSRLRALGEEVTVHTGQHYDAELSQVFFDELELPPPEHLLGIGGGTNTAQTARMLAALEPLIADVRPDAVLVYGDTNSTLAGALAAVQAGVPVAHVEAGMRSFDRAMPEEVNRVLTDHLSALLLCPSDTAVDNLCRESVAGAVEQVGDVMVDVAQLLQPLARARTEALTPYRVEPGGYLLAAVEAAPGLRLASPLGYLDFAALLCNARAVVTDSGGVQKEAYLAGVPCVTLRPSTEWVETVDAGWNVLVDLDAAEAVAALDRPLPAERPQLYGDGRAGERVAAAVRALAEPALA